MKGIKGILLSAAGLLLSLAYLAGVVGFDVHTDNHEGRTYVVSLLSDISCESIHPGDVCSCCEHHHDCASCHGEGLCQQEEDCQDAACFLEITGDGGDGQHTDFTPVSCIALRAPFHSAVPGISPVLFSQRPLSPPPPREHLSLLCVLRV